MYLIDCCIEEEIKTLKFHGQIDSTNAEEVNTLIAEKLVDCKNFIFDFSDVNYISSAGLRVILKYGKTSKNFQVINVSSEVFEILDMTGFTQILNIKKAMRVISIEGKEMIGEGYLGRVYRLDNDTIIKVFYRNSSLEDIQREISLAKKAFILGIPTAIPFDVVRVKEGGYGSVFELLKSKCFNKLFIEHPENEDKNVQLYIDLLKTIISLRVEDKKGIPNKKDDAKRWYSILEENKTFDEPTLKQIKGILETIPEDNHIIHGDFHIKNIMMQGDEPLLIDMDTLGYGHEIFELSAFFLTYIGYPSTEVRNCEAFLGISDRVAQRLFYDSINCIYSGRTQNERETIIKKISLYGYIWLAAKTYIFEPQNLKRLNHCRDEVVRLLKEVDTLNF